MNITSCGFEKFGADDTDLGIMMVFYNMGVGVITEGNHVKLEKMKSQNTPAFRGIGGSTQANTGV